MKGEALARNGIVGQVDRIKKALARNGLVEQVDRIKTYLCGRREC